MTTCPCCSPKLEAMILQLMSLDVEDGSIALLPILLTLLLDDDPEKGVGRGQGFVVVVVIVDGQEVPMDVHVAQEHVHPWDLVQHLQQAVEACAGVLHSEVAKLSVKLQRRRKRVRLGRAGSGQQDLCRQGMAPRQWCPSARACPKSKIKGVEPFSSPNTQVTAWRGAQVAEKGPSGHATIHGAAKRLFPVT